MHWLMNASECFNKNQAYGNLLLFFRLLLFAFWLIFFFFLNINVALNNLRNVHIYWVLGLYFFCSSSDKWTMKQWSFSVNSSERARFFYKLRPLLAFSSFAFAIVKAFFSHLFVSRKKSLEAFWLRLNCELSLGFFSPWRQSYLVCNFFLFTCCALNISILFWAQTMHTPLDFY